MGVKQWVRAMLVLAALPSSAFALGLGDIRLSSPLNAPLDAEIDLVNATPEELSSLKVQLASRETFARYGLEWPTFLSSVTLVRGKSDSGRDVLRVRSNEAITEPFVTLLVDANWGRGRLVREYTLLLDPPVFAPAPTPAPMVQAPATSAARSGSVTRPAAAAPSPAAAVEPVAAAGVGGGASDYPVRRGETLSGIASGIASAQGVSTEQAMVGLYRNNPNAFDGTMNVLRAGAVLRVPDSASLSSIDRSSAIAEVRRQRSEWRSRAPGGTSADAASGDAGRLRLVPPSEAGGGSGAGSDAAARETQGMRDRVAQLEKELNESRRLLEVRSAQIADLQQRLATGGSGAPAPAAPATPDAAAPVAAPPPVAEAPAVAATDTPVPAATPAAGEPAATAPADAADTTAKPKKKRIRPAAVTETPAEEPSLLDSVLEYWWALAGLLVAAAAFFGYRKWQEGRAAAIDDTFGGATTTAAPAEMAVAPPSVVTDTARLRRPNVAAPDKSGFLVEESGEFEAPRLGGTPAPAAAAKSVSADDTLSGETGINLDQGDPLAEADFHMAYGLYDQAADLVRLAAAREPERRDLKLKLAEVFFVWGNRDEFLKTARDLHGSLGDAAAGEWDKIVIMGKQIAPEDPLFSQATARGAGAAGLDLQLDGGAQPLDFDVFGDGSTSSTQTIESVAGSDLDFGPGRRGDVESTIERPGPATGSADAATVLVEAGGGTTREMAPQFGESPTAESPRLDVDLDELLGGARTDSGDSPTVEQPALRGSGGPTIRAKLDAALKQNAPASDQTAELAIDDLGLDLGDLDKLGDLDSAGPAELSHDDREDAAADAPTMLASFDDEAQQLIEKAAATRRGNGHDTTVDIAATAAMETLRVDTSELDRHVDAGATSMVAALDTTHLDSDDFDLDKLGTTGTHQVADADLDIDIGQATLSGTATDTNTPRSAFNGAAAAEVDDVALPSLEPVTISEVGTKLDLARAYMDMGDPDGARNILREVLAEGSVSQKQEANRLLESLPG